MKCESDDCENEGTICVKTDDGKISLCADCDKLMDEIYGGGFNV